MTTLRETRRLELGSVEALRLVPGSALVEASAASSARFDGRWTRVVQRVPATTTAGAYLVPDGCGSWAPEALPEGKGISSSASYVHTISEASFNVPSDQTACPGSVAVEAEAEDMVWHSVGG